MIELSADLGEGSPGEDELWPLITSANVACGGHTGDEESMRNAAHHASQHDVRFGAHPSYPDRENFGRNRSTLHRTHCALHSSRNSRRSANSRTSSA